MLDRDVSEEVSVQGEGVEYLKLATFSVQTQEVDEGWGAVLDKYVLQQSGVFDDLRPRAGSLFVGAEKLSSTTECRIRGNLKFDLLPSSASDNFSLYDAGPFVVTRLFNGLNTNTAPPHLVQEVGITDDLPIIGSDVKVKARIADALQDPSVGPKLALVLRPSSLYAVRSVSKNGSGSPEMQRERCKLTTCPSTEDMRQAVQAVFDSMPAGCSVWKVITWTGT